MDDVTALITAARHFSMEQMPVNSLEPITYQGQTLQW
jgi:hypothetical protein